MKKTLLIFLVILIIPINLYAAPSITTTVKTVGEIAKMIMTLRQAGYPADLVESQIIKHGKFESKSLRDFTKTLVKEAYKIPREELLTKQVLAIEAYKKKWEEITLIVLTRKQGIQMGKFLVITGYTILLAIGAFELYANVMYFIQITQG